MFRRLLHRLRITLLAATLPACVRQLPPAPPPAAVVPPLPAAAPPAAGQGRLVVDIVGAPAPVQRIRMDTRPSTNARGRTSYQFFEVPEVLCTASPCVTDVPAGSNVLLGFPVLGDDRLEVELVHVGPAPSVYRRSLSIYENHTGGERVFGIIATTFGATAAIAGTVLLPVGLSKDNNTMAAAGGITLGAGAVLLALGIWAIRDDAPTFRPGASNHFPLAGTF